MREIVISYLISNNLFKKIDNEKILPPMRGPLSKLFGRRLKDNLARLAVGFVVELTIAHFLPESNSTDTCKEYVKQSGLSQQSAHDESRLTIRKPSDEPDGGADVNSKQHDESKLYGAKDRVAEVLSRKVRVLCWIMTGTANHATKAAHVKATWAKRCNRYIFFSSTVDESLPTLKLAGVGEGRKWLWGKTRLAFQYLFQNHLNDYDWFLKADDDTYVLVENLRFMLITHAPSEPIAFGCRFKQYIRQGYFSGGAGYVLSREALSRTVSRGFRGDKICKAFDYEGYEDIEMGRCLAKVGVRIGDSTDSKGSYRFHPYTPQQHIIPGRLDNMLWLWMYVYYPMKEGFEASSDVAISFHYVTPDMMYLFDYLIYHLKPFGMETIVTDALHNGKLPGSLSSNEILTLAERLSEKYRSSDDIRFDPNTGAVISNHSKVPLTGGVFPDSISGFRQKISLFFAHVYSSIFAS